MNKRRTEEQWAVQKKKLCSWTTSTTWNPEKPNRRDNWLLS